MQEFIEELKYNQNVNIQKGLENRVDIDYVIERLENISFPIFDNGEILLGKAKDILQYQAVLPPFQRKDCTLIPFKIPSLT